MFGNIVGEDMQLNEAGSMVFQIWNDMASWFFYIEIDSFVVMPNHIHGIVVINKPMDAALYERNAMHVGAPLVGASSYEDDIETTPRATTRVAPTLGEVIGAFKSLTTVEYARRVKSSAWPEFPGRLWQRNYYEHVIRKEDSMHRICRYIEENPARWALDHENPARRRM